VVGVVGGGGGFFGGGQGCGLGDYLGLGGEFVVFLSVQRGVGLL